MCRVLVDAFGGSSTSNLLEPQQHRDNTVFSVISHEFRVVRLYRTFSSYIGTGETRCAGCSWTRSVHVHRTSSNLLEPQHRTCTKVRCAGCFCTSSGWFKRIEPPRPFWNHSRTELYSRTELAGRVAFQTPMKDLYTPCELCRPVVREGSRRCDVREPPRPRAEAPCTPCFPCRA